MQKLTRRKFTTHVLATGLLPSSITFLHRDLPSGEKPDTAAGYTMTREEAELAERFIATHNKNMEPLRARDLLNSLPPFFCLPLAPSAGGKKK